MSAKTSSRQASDNFFTTKNLGKFFFSVTATDGTAQTPGDYILLTSSVHLTPGATRHEISVRIMDDVSVENNETFSLNLNNGRNTRIRVSGNEEMTILIVDDDG